MATAIVAPESVHPTDHEAAMGFARVYVAADGVRVGVTRRGTIYCGTCQWTECPHLMAVRVVERGHP